MECSKGDNPRSIIDYQQQVDMFSRGQGIEVLIQEQRQRIFLG